MENGKMEEEEKKKQREEENDGKLPNLIIFTGYGHGMDSQLFGPLFGVIMPNGVDERHHASSPNELKEKCHQLKWL
jgi:hypothetical protein